MAIRNDLTNKKINHWTVLKELGGGKVLCQCDCEAGTIREVYKQALLNNRSKSCGCAGKSMVNNKEVIKFKPGDKVFEWEILEKIPGTDMYKARCSCGEIRNIYRSNLIRGTHKSCGHEKVDSWNKFAETTFGEWKVLSKVDRNRVLCQCSCGTKRILYKKTLTSGKSKSCGCKSIQNKNNTMQDKYAGYLNKTINEWTILDTSDISTFVCRCSCGNIRRVAKKSILDGTSKSCGCKSNDFMKNTMLERYGDITASRASTPREEWQIKAISNADSLAKYLKSFENKLTLKEASDNLSITEYHLSRLLKKFELRDLVIFSTVRSNFEEEVYQFILSNSQYNIKTNSRDELNGLELDIYIPELSLAIECNGDYWHSELFKDSNYHLRKTIECNKLGIELIHIFEYEWNTRREQVQSIILNKLNTSNKIYARNTIVKEISSSEAKEFLESNHLQGYAVSNINIALMYDNKIVYIVTFGKPRFDDSDSYELIRACGLKCNNIVGGFSKVLNYFYNKYNPDSIVTYADRAKFNGKVYINNGFKLISYTNPSYIWSNGNKVLARYTTMKHKLVENNLGTDNESESDIMHRLGYFKIYNCGNLKLIWSNNERK